MEIDTVVWRFFKCAGLCLVSALPSFVLARGERYDVTAIGVGVAIFIIALTIITSTQAFRELQARPFVRRSLAIGYLARIVATVVFPVGFVMDMILGSMSVQLAGALYSNSHGFTGTLVTTLLHGVALNAVVLTFAAAIYGLQRISTPVPVSQGVCAKCGYDLRASPMRCPECGEATKQAQDARLGLA